MIKNIKLELAKELFENNEACIIDVRELSEHKAQSIKGSFLIPSGEFDGNKIPTKFRDKKVIIHCQRGGRASRACEKMSYEFPEIEVYNLEGGILGWAEKGFATVCAYDKKPIMSIERQVRLALGAVIILGCALMIFANLDFIVIPAFVGLGLVLSAIFDYCGMAKFLAKMPWNKN